jgi:uncharacterized protein CbrC (UPF0167 family)
MRAARPANPTSLVAQKRIYCGDLRVQKPSPLDKTLAAFCVNCPVCRRARKQQRGAAFWLVKQIESRMCPFCRAYERVYGRPAHEASASQQSSPQAGTPTP